MESSGSNPKISTAEDSLYSIYKFGAFLHAVRKAMQPKPSVNKLAKDLGIAPNTLTNWELGLSLPKQEMLADLARVYCVPEKDLQEMNKKYEISKQGSKSGKKFKNVPHNSAFKPKSS